MEEERKAIDELVKAMQNILKPKEREGETYGKGTEETGKEETS